MMPKQLPDVRQDKGYQEEAREYAQNIMNAKMRCNTLEDFPKWLHSLITVAYLQGAQSALRIGYRLCERDYEEVLTYYKKKNRRNRIRTLNHKIIPIWNAR